MGRVSWVRWTNSNVTITRIWARESNDLVTFGLRSLFLRLLSESLHNPSLLLRRLVFRMAEASAKREWLVMNRKGFPPSFARRETSGYEADIILCPAGRCFRLATNAYRSSAFRSYANKIATKEYTLFIWRKLLHVIVLNNNIRKNQSSE